MIFLFKTQNETWEKKKRSLQQYFFSKVNKPAAFFPPFFCMARHSDHTGSIVRIGCRKRVFTPSCERAMAFTVRSIFKRAHIFTIHAVCVCVCLQVHVVITHNIYAHSYSWNIGNSGLRVPRRPAGRRRSSSSSVILSGCTDLCSQTATLTAAVPNSARETMKILVERNHKNHPPCTCMCMETRPPTCLQSCGSPSLLLRRRVARKVENKASFFEVGTVCWPSADQRPRAFCLLIRNAPIWIPKISHLFELLVAL